MTKRYWNAYQKEIAEDHYFYERSCIRQTFFPGSEAAFLRIMREELHKDIKDEANQHTCTGIGYHSDIVPLETTMTVVARLFSLMQEDGYTNYVPSCVTSFGIFSEMIDIWEHQPEMLEKTRENLYKIFRRSWISTDMLFKISIVLKHDFFKDCSIWLGQGLVTDTRLLETMHKKEKHTTRDG